MIPVDQWRWFGCAGHLAVASACRYHLHTRIGDWRISTVGDYRPERHGPMETIGSNRYYETFVFRVAGEDHDGEGEVTEWSEVDTDIAQTEAEAREAHMKMCRKYAAGKRHKA